MPLQSQLVCQTLKPVMSLATPLSPEVNNSAAGGDLIEHSAANTGSGLKYFDTVTSFFGFPCCYQARETRANDSNVSLSLNK